jgi:hypothetical protein
MRCDKGGRNLNALSFDVKEICLIKLDSICRVESRGGRDEPGRRKSIDWCRPR